MEVNSCWASRPLGAEGDTSGGARSLMTFLGVKVKGPDLLGGPLKLFQQEAEDTPPPLSHQAQAAAPTALRAKGGWSC